MNTKNPDGRLTSGFLIPSKVFSVFAVACVLLSCASPLGIKESLDRYLAQHQYAEAAAAVETGKGRYYGEKNALLFYLDRGMLLHLAGQHQESNEAFEQAKRTARELFTKSVTVEASTFLVSDNVRPYYGEDFERALIHFFCSLNYVMLNQGNEALVEARQVDFLLTKLKTDYGHKNTYKEDALVRYVMGMIYENQGQLNDAFISYRQALEAYDLYRANYGTPLPQALIGDALRTAQALRFGDRVQEIQRRWGGSIPPARQPGQGEVIVLHYNGLAPHKVDSFFEIGFIAGWAYVDAAKPQGQEKQQVEQAGAIARSILADAVVRMAFPKYEHSPYQIAGLRVAQTGAASTATAELAEDIGAIAMKNLQERVLRIRAKTIARSVVKFALSQKIAQKVKEKQGEGLGWLAQKIMQVASTATELADKRCWQTLPDRVLVARLPLSAGKHSITCSFTNASGQTVSSQEIKEVEVVEGKKTFVYVRTVQ